MRFTPLQAQLPLLDNPLSVRIRGVIETIKQQRSTSMQVMFSNCNMLANTFAFDARLQNCYFVILCLCSFNYVVNHM